MSSWRVPGVILGAALLVAGVASYFSSAAPDGLGRVAADRDFATRETPPPIAVAPNYEVPGLGRLSGRSVAGVGGALVVLGAGLGVGYALLRRRRD